MELLDREDGADATASWPEDPGEKRAGKEKGGGGDVGGEGVRGGVGVVGGGWGGGGGRY